MMNRIAINKVPLLFLALFLIVPAFTAGAASRTIVVNKVAAVVNGEMITMLDVQKMAVPEINRQGLHGADASSEAKRQAIFKEALDNMVMDILVRQEADRFKVSVTDSEVDNEVRMLAQQSRLTPKQFEDQLILQGTTITQFKEQVRNNILRQRMLNLMVGRKIMVTREEVERYYNDHKNQYTSEDEVELSMIAFKPDADPAEVQRTIESGAMTFADAASAYSSAPNASYGGSLGSIPLRDLNPAWRDAVSGLESGGLSDILESGGDRILLRVDVLHRGKVKSLDEVAPEIEATLREPLLAERFGEFMEQLRSRAVVDIRM